MEQYSGGCARKRAAMSVTLTAVKRVQSSPNLLTSDIWGSYNDYIKDGLNGDSSGSSLAAKGFRSVRPNLQEKKSPTQTPVTVNGNSGSPSSPMSHFQRPFSPTYPFTPPLNSMQQNRTLDSADSYSQLYQSEISRSSSTIPICRISEEEKKVTVIKAPHYPGIGPVDESGIPTAIRTTVDRPKDWYKTMFKQIHMVHKPDNDSDYSNTSYAFNTENYIPAYSHPAAKTQTYRPLSKSVSDNGTDVLRSTSPLPPPPIPVPPPAVPLRPRELASPEKELSFKKGDTVYILRKIDKNWYEGEHHGRVGIFPISYVEKISQTEKAQPVRPPPPAQVREIGEAVAKYNFTADTNVELTLKKGDRVMILKKVDQNWYEGKIPGTNRQGIFPVSYVEITKKSSSKSPGESPDRYSTERLHNAATTTINLSLQQRAAFSHENIQTMGELYQSLYNYTPRNEDELELREGDVIDVMEKCDDGWFVGTSRRTKFFGTFPGNYVKRL
uniref:Sorbin and SH3 domain-containing protein 2 n=1 Tax=Pyxicephalus adspersus TaxID=30357 RepID=A0AAV3AMU4_PYXAD|nr:TPA: hypothetical protein GDO54_009396 [Pyxicephalus adspersus]